MSRIVPGIVLVALLLLVAPGAGAKTRECDGLQVCVPVAGPWVLVPLGSGARKPTVEFQLTCPRGYIVGGLDAELSARQIEVRFLGRLGSPVNPGISTGRSVVFVARYVGEGARAPSFRPRVGCMPAAGGGVRVPTAASAVPPGEPVVRRVRTARVRPGTTRIAVACRGRERLVGASHALGFLRGSPPSPSLAATLSASRFSTGRRALLTVLADAELGGVRALAQLHALCGVGR
ncbi:MAG: hypothetical protein RMM28_08490 [Thermoleophilia bacterium]|nr:hypothetical protein [Gaiellaceae bacterium]MDW8339160.1 hypothetical protein [Thermoleophilia bacterium]